MRHSGRMPARTAALLLAALCAGAGCGETSGPSGDAAALPTTTRPAPPDLPAAEVRPFDVEDPDVVVIVTGGTHGMLEVCDCPGIRLTGGQASRSGLAASYRAAFEHVLLIDIGDAFHVDPDAVANEYVLRGFERMGYDAVVLADHELALAADDLKRRLPDGLTYVGTNLLAPAGLPVVPEVRWEWGDVKLALVSDLRAEALRFLPPARQEAAMLAPPEEVSRRIDALKRDGYVVLLAVHGGFGDAEQAAQDTRADVVLRGHVGVGRPEPREIAGTWIVQSGGSQTAGVLALDVADGRIVAADWGLEVLDDHWPLDSRLLELFKAYLRELTERRAPV